MHTDIPGEALTESQKYGELELAKIENMRIQALDQLAGQKPVSTDDLKKVEEELEGKAEEPGETPEAEPEKEYGVVTVCAGDGMEDVFRELGVDGIVTGGQTMNPSTEDILREIRRTPASKVFVLPNNKNIIMAAEQCIPLTKKRVIVMPTKTVPQGVAALLSMNVDQDEGQIVADMTETIGHVHTAMVTYAARDSEFDGHNIRAGEYLALLDGGLVDSFPEPEEMFRVLARSFEALEPEFITIYYGENVTAEEAEEAAQGFRARFENSEVTVVRGGQPVYYYMIGVE